VTRDTERGDGIATATAERTASLQLPRLPHPVRALCRAIKRIITEASINLRSGLGLLLCQPQRRLRAFELVEALWRSLW